MRSLSGELTGAQKSMGNALVKVVLTKTDEATLTYGMATTNRIRHLTHNESELSQRATLVVDNADQNLTGLDIRGYKGVISWGYRTSTDEYSAAAPLWVTAQRNDTSQGDLRTTLSLKGVFDLMAMEESSKQYSLPDDSAYSVKTLLTRMAQATFSNFNHCKAYTITFDSEDSLIATLKLKDHFTVGFKESRLSAFMKALRWTGCKAIIKADGAIHVFDPDDGITHYTSGSTYNYEYNDAVSEHNFYAKSTRKRVVIPGYTRVFSHPDYIPVYTGYAEDGDYDDQPENLQIREHLYLRVTSNSQAGDVAAARLLHNQLDAEKGYGLAPLNCGQEFMDFVNITDSWAGDSRKGNVGYINREYFPGTFKMGFGFGKPEFAPMLPVDPGAPLGDQFGVLADAYGELRADINFLAGMVNLIVQTDETVIPKLHVTHEFKGPVVITNAPVVDTLAVTNVADTTATGNLTIRALGIPDPTAYGICWSTSVDPDTSDDTTDEGGTSSTGDFTSSITGLTASTTYYYNAYATNAAGTQYGIQLEFTTTS